LHQQIIRRNMNVTAMAKPIWIRCGYLQRESM
jgi:hypothetical protein